MGLILPEHSQHHQRSAGGCWEGVDIIGELLAGHLVEDDEREDVNPGTGIRTHGGGTYQEVALVVEDERQLGGRLVVSIKEERLTVWDIYHTILSVQKRDIEI